MNQEIVLDTRGYARAIVFQSISYLCTRLNLAIESRLLLEDTKSFPGQYWVCGMCHDLTSIFTLPVCQRGHINQWAKDHGKKCKELQDDLTFIQSHVKEIQKAWSQRNNHHDDILDAEILEDFIPCSTDPGFERHLYTLVYKKRCSELQEQLLERSHQIVGAKMEYNWILSGKGRNRLIAPPNKRKGMTPIFSFHPCSISESSYFSRDWTYQNKRWTLPVIPEKKKKKRRNRRRKKTTVNPFSAYQLFSIKPIVKLG